MATVNFYLKSPKNETSLIMLKSYLNGRNFRYSFNISLPVIYWDAEKQRAKRTYNQSLTINSILDKITSKVKECDNKASLNGELLTDDYLREQLNILLGKTEEQATLNNCLLPLLEEFIESSKRTKQPNTIKKYDTLLIHLKEFESKKNKKLLIKEVDKIYEPFQDLLIGKGLNNQSIGKYIQAYKVFVNDLVYRKVIAPVNLKAWKVDRSPGTVIVLNENEVKAIEKTKKLTDRLQKAKNLFLFACYTGLRFSDVQNLKKQNVNGQFLRLTTIKTKENLVIPLSQKAIDILNIYENELPKVSNQKLNEAIHDLCQIAGLDDEIEIVSFSGTKRKTENFKKYELITFHTARKTCITSLLKKGLATEIIQRIVGIEDYRTLKFYINMNNDKSIYDDFFKLVN